VTPTPKTVLTIMAQCSMMQRDESRAKTYLFLGIVVFWFFLR